MNCEHCGKEFIEDDDDFGCIACGDVVCNDCNSGEYFNKNATYECVCKRCINLLGMKGLVISLKEKEKQLAILKNEIEDIVTLMSDYAGDGYVRVSKRT